MSTTTKVTPEADNKALKKVLVDLVGNIQQEPEQADLVFSATSKLNDGFLVDVNIRDFNFQSDEPADLGGTDKGPNPVEYVLGALAACQEIVVKAHATVLGINISELTVEVEGQLDLQGFLGLSDNRPGFKHVNFVTTIKTDETDSEKLKKLENLTFNNCPVLDIIQNPTSVDGQVRFID
ncbi:MAG: OsmC family protein [Balneolaceae bacterium]